MITNASELPDDWQTSSHSTGNGACVQAHRKLKGTVRDSKDPSGPALEFTPEAWSMFCTWVATTFEV
ncbi:DUF397 domain-containing protein [Kitasatospora sp. NPDC101801]|uniref:DUF397 domain-containing protein n=1 Tax=Kitasatospora sp. NPDC101801 TaxID=3364103 RepID=UPI00380A6B7B